MCQKSWVRNCHDPDASCHLARSNCCREFWFLFWLCSCSFNLSCPVMFPFSECTRPGLKLVIIQCTVNKLQSSIYPGLGFSPSFFIAVYLDCCMTDSLDELIHIAHMCTIDIVTSKASSTSHMWPRPNEEWAFAISFCSPSSTKDCMLATLVPAWRSGFTLQRAEFGQSLNLYSCCRSEYAKDFHLWKFYTWGSIVSGERWGAQL